MTVFCNISSTSFSSDIVHTDFIGLAIKCSYDHPGVDLCIILPVTVRPVVYFVCECFLCAVFFVLYFLCFYDVLCL